MTDSNGSGGARRFDDPGCDVEACKELMAAIERAANVEGIRGSNPTAVVVRIVQERISRMLPAGWIVQGVTMNGEVAEELSKIVGLPPSAVAGAGRVSIGRDMPELEDPEFIVHPRAVDDPELTPEERALARFMSIRDVVEPWEMFAVQSRFLATIPDDAVQTMNDRWRELAAVAKQLSLAKETFCYPVWRVVLAHRRAVAGKKKGGSAK